MSSDQLSIPPAIPVLDNTPPSASSFLTTPFRWFDIVIGLLPPALFCGSRLFVRPTDVFSFEAYMAITVAVMTWMILYPCLRRRALTGTMPTLWRGRRHFWTNLGWGCLFVLLSFFVMVVIALIETAFVDEPSQGSFGDPLNYPVRAPIALIVFFLVAATIGPLAEEIFFRGFLYSALRRSLGFWFALLLQAILFAAMHPLQLVGSIKVFFIGIILGLLFAWRKTILAPLVTHGIWNGLMAGFVLIGIALQANSPAIGVYGDDIPDFHGFRVQRVLPDSPAQRAGIEKDDLIVAVNGERFLDFRDFIFLVREHRPGEEVSIQYYRDGVLLETNIVLGWRKDVYDK